MIPLSIPRSSVQPPEVTIYDHRIFDHVMYRSPDPSAGALIDMFQAKIERLEGKEWLKEEAKRGWVLLP